MIADCFLRIHGIEGESTDCAHGGWHDVVGSNTSSLCSKLLPRYRPAMNGWP